MATFRLVTLVATGIALAALRQPVEAASYSRTLPAHPSAPASAGSQLDPNLSPNQQARIDIIDPAAPIDTTGVGVWQNVYTTTPGSPGDPNNPMTGYVTVSAFVPGGRTVRLRFAEVDTEFFFNFGVDHCSMDIGIGDVLVNGSFESNGGAGTSSFTGWSTYEENLGTGAFFVQTGIASPINAFPVPAPPDGSFAAMSDQDASGLRILYQDVAIPAGGAQLSCDIYIASQADFALGGRGPAPAPALGPFGLALAVLVLALVGRRIAGNRPARG